MPDSPLGLPRYENTEGLVFGGADFFPGVEFDKEMHQIWRARRRIFEPRSRMVQPQPRERVGRPL